MEHIELPLEIRLELHRRRYEDLRNSDEGLTEEQEEMWGRAIQKLVEELDE